MRANSVEFAALDLYRAARDRHIRKPNARDAAYIERYLTQTYKQAWVINIELEHCGIPKAEFWRRNYEFYRSTDDWKEIRNQTFVRFGHRCALCNSEDNLEPHHRTYERLGEEWPRDLTCLCRACHEGFHKMIGGAVRTVTAAAAVAVDETTGEVLA